MVEALKGSGKDIEHGFEALGCGGAVDDSEGSAAQCGVDLAGVVAVGSAPLDDDGGGRGLESAEDFEESQAAAFGGARVIAEVQGEAQIDDGDVDAVGLDDLLGLTTRVGAQGGDTHGFEEGREAVGPGLLLPATEGEEEVQAAVGGGAHGLMLGGLALGHRVWIGAHRCHGGGTVARRVPRWSAWWGMHGGEGWSGASGPLPWGLGDGVGPASSAGRRRRREVGSREVGSRGEGDCTAEGR